MLTISYSFFSEESDLLYEFNNILGVICLPKIIQVEFIYSGFTENQRNETSTKPNENHFGNFKL